MKIKNPFIINGYVSSEYFCDRVNETATLTSAFTNGRNMVIVSPRRMGKTGLIQHCFSQNNIANEYYTFFIDIYATGSMKEFVYILGKHIFNTLKPKGISILEQFFASISSLRPAFKLDPITGEPVFDIGIGDIRQPELSIEEIFKYLETADKPCLVAIDEFQQIAKYPEKNVEAILRTHIQKCTNAVFVFSGSQRHMMQNIFFSASRPFYQSATFMNLDAISENVYCSFVQQHFENECKKISEECIRRIYELFEGHTWYMQTIFNRLFENTDRKETMTLENADIILKQTINANETVYQNLVVMLSERQKEILFAIAKEGCATEITSTAFIKKHGLNSPSSVQSATKQLLDKEFITKDGNVYRVYDRFFGLWLAQIYGIGYKL